MSTQTQVSIDIMQHPVFALISREHQLTIANASLDAQYHDPEQTSASIIAGMYDVLVRFLAREARYRQHAYPYMQRYAERG